MKIHNFGRNELKVLDGELQKALDEVGKKFGISLKMGGGKFTNQNCTIKIEGSIISADGEVVTKEVSDFKTLCELYGFQKDDLGKEFTAQGKTYKITGLSHKSHKYPIIASCGDKSFKFTADRVKDALAR